MNCFMMRFNNVSKDHLPANMIMNIVTFYKNIYIDAADLMEGVPTFRL